jgi:sporulation-control protein spo0M
MGPSLRPQGRRQPGFPQLALNQQIAEITPFKVLALNQFDLPVTLPSFQLLLTGDCLVWPVTGLDINEAMNAVGFDKRGAVAIAVRGQSLLQGIGRPDRVP